MRLIQLIEEAYIEEKYSDDPKKARKVAERYMRMKMGNAAKNYLGVGNNHYQDSIMKTNRRRQTNYLNPDEIKSKAMSGDNDLYKEKTFIRANKEYIPPKPFSTPEYVGFGLGGAGLGGIAGAGIGAGIDYLFGTDNGTLIGTGLGGALGAGAGITFASEGNRNLMDEYAKKISKRNVARGKIDAFNNTMEDAVNKVNKRYKDKIDKVNSSIYTL